MNLRELSSGGLADWLSYADLNRVLAFAMSRTRRCAV